MYEYECTKCGHRFELIQLFSASPKTKCPVCRGTLRKLISASAIQFKGSGWYVTDYAKKSGGSETGKGSEGPAGDGKSSEKSGEKSEKSEKGEKGEKAEKGKSEERSSGKEKPGGKKGSS
ncbi:MAG TPA: zinc ribbon domain-containing protein [Candidatus Polarisedimenticolia bacterium]|jgi:putative FmdB family regulatory protein